MLTSEEAARLKQLVEGHRAPEDGLEAHFLRVTRGEATPCSPKEQLWYEHWRQTGGDPKVEVQRLNYEKTAALLSEREKRIEQLEGRIDELTREQSRTAEKNRFLLLDKDNAIESLKKEISTLEKWLKNAHKTIEKYEPLPPPIVTDAQATNERRMRKAEHDMSYMLTKGNYSSTDGQD